MWGEREIESTARGPAPHRRDISCFGQGSLLPLVVLTRVLLRIAVADLVADVIYLTVFD